MEVGALPAVRDPSAVAWGLRRVPMVVGRMAAILGGLCPVDAFSRRTAPLLDWFTPRLPVPVRLTAQTVVTVSGLPLPRPAAGLRRRKRAEWRIAVFIVPPRRLKRLIGRA